MKQKIGYFIHTEYHLISAINDIQNNYNSLETNEITLLLKRPQESKRLSQELNLSFLPYNVKIIPFKANLDRVLLPEEKEILEEVVSLRLDVFNFFQEQDALAIILINKLKEQGTKIHLYQDGLKPYVIQTLKFSPGIFINDIKQNIWIKKNGFHLANYFSFLHCNKYGFLKGIDKLFLSYPSFYPNWNSLPIETVSTEINPQILLYLKQIFNWDEKMLKVRNQVVFYLNQPLNDDSSFDETLLKNLSKKHPGAKIYIKLHPLTSQAKRDLYHGLSYVEVLDYAVPAELFISQLENAVVLSLYSTAMFMNNPRCKFYYLYDTPEAQVIKRLKKISLINPTPHIMTIKKLDDISF